MAHKFNEAHRHKLDSDWRRSVMSVDKTIKALEIKSDENFADIGCGIGYFTIPIASMLQAPHKIFALDTSQLMLSELESRAHQSQLSNIMYVKTSEYDFGLETQTVSYALMVNVLHEIDDKIRFIEEARRILTPQGRLGIIEWKKASMNMGPPLDHRLSDDHIRQILNHVKFRCVKSFDVHAEFKGYIFQK